MTSKHTPGPWKVKFSNISEVVAENGALIARCNRLGSLVDLKANSTLIAQCPELFRIVERLSKLADGLANGNSSAEELATELAKQAQIVVAKATGEA
jgi:hypothetical protein